MAGWTAVAPGIGGRVRGARAAQNPARVRVYDNWGRRCKSQAVNRKPFTAHPVVLRRGGPYPSPTTMLTPESALAFFSLSLVLALAPGPDNLFVLMVSAAEGRRAGFAVVLGLMLGVMVHTLAVALGLAALFAASATAFTVLKLAGAAYLLYLAWGAWHAPASLQAADTASGAAQGWPRLVARGVVMNLTNPKVLLFFLALLPQFVVPGSGSVAGQIVQLGALFIVAGGLVFSAIVLAAAALRGRLARSARAQRWVQRSAAVVFAGLALRLVTAQR